MSRYRKVSLLLLLLLLFCPGFTASALENKGNERDDRVVEEFIEAVILKAADPGTRPAKRDRDFRKAVDFARTYSIVTGNNVLDRKIRYRILTLSSSQLTGKEEFLKEFQEPMRKESRLMKSQSIAGIQQKLEELTEGLIGRALQPGTSQADRAKLLATVLNLAQTYGAKSGNRYFQTRTEHLVKALPSASSLTSDSDIVKEFQKAMQHDNRFFMELLVKRVEPRIEPFVAAIIDRASKPGLLDSEKDLLLKTAMNFAKTYGNLTDDHAFHRKIHRKTFTARLSDTVRGAPVEGVVVVDSPAASDGVKNIFTPNNIIVQSGETVRWINHDRDTHVIGTIDFLSDGHFFAPDIGFMDTFERTFVLPGEYYYICYIHNYMIGKVTVKE